MSVLANGGTVIQASRGCDQFALRLPDGMRARIKAAATKNGRSMNSEIVYQLDRLYPAPEKNDDGARFGDGAPSSSQNQPVSAG
jgi:hypothetical protein